MSVIKRIYQNVISIVDSNIYIYLGLIFCIYMIYSLSLRSGPAITYLFAIFPMILALTGLISTKPYNLIILFFVLNYFIMPMGRYIESLKPGMIMLGLSLSILMYLVAFSVFKKLEWNRIRTPFLYLWLFWLAFCSTQLFRPDVVFEAWSISIGTYALFAVCMAIFIPLVLNQFKDLQLLLFLWSVFIIFATIKGWWQKSHGFDAKELQWLWAYGYRTHFLRTGIRYFSFFTDAANYGTSNGFSLIVFAISSFYFKNKLLRIYFLLIASMSLYGMLISGTRSATAIPFMGIACFIFLSKSPKSMLIGTLLIISSYVFLNYTTIGDENRFIRRLRTSFDTQDASLVVRQENQKLLRTYMADHPFGVGMGLSAGRASRWMSDSTIPSIANDSWWVMVWTETGIVGLSLYLSMIAIMYAWGAYIILFKIKSKRLRGILAALFSGSIGLFASSYGNEVMGYPNGVLSSMAMVYVFIGPRIDKELLEEENTALESQKKLDDAKQSA